MFSFLRKKKALLEPVDFLDGLKKNPDKSEIATIGGNRDITRGFIPPNLIMPYGDTVLDAKGDGSYSIYEELARDDQVKTCRQQRELALISKEWGVDPGDSSRKAKYAADRIRALLERLQWDDKTQKMLSAVLYGFAVSELLWITDGSEITLSDIKVRNRSRFGFLPSGELRLKTLNQMTTGEQLPPAKFWAFSCGADHDDDPYGLGLGHYLYWPVFFKKNGIKFWLIFLEKFGQPTALGKYPISASEEEKTKLLKALGAIQSSTAIRIPEGMEVELLEAARSGTADYTALVDRMNAAISKVYLGHAGSTDATPGRLGGEENAGEVREDLIKADADLICGSFNRTVARWITYYNDGDTVAPPKVWRKTDPPEDLKSCADKDKVLFDMGYKPTLKYVTEKYGEGYDEAPVDQAAQTQTPNTPQFAEASGPIKFTPGQMVIENLAESAINAAKSPIDPELIAGAIRAAKDPEDLEQRLAQVLQTSDLSEFNSILEKSLFTADVLGYAHGG